ncbi:hypothetical protein RYX36_028171 [Vicia faba]
MSVPIGYRHFNEFMSFGAFISTLAEIIKKYPVSRLFKCKRCWFWDISSHLVIFNMSHNELQGRLPNPMPMAVASLVMVDLSFNLLDGPLPVITPGFQMLDLSHNHFSGVIPSNISQHMGTVEFLSLSGNQLHREIPLSLEEMSYVTVIDLSENNLTGPCKLLLS